MSTCLQITVGASREMLQMRHTDENLCESHLFHMNCFPTSFLMLNFTLTMAETRSSSTVWLLGKTEKEIICGALPTKGHTLQKMVYHHLQEHHTVRESAKLSVQAVCAYWEKARIPVQRVDSCERKLLKLYDAYKLVKKNRTKTFENYRVKEQMFKDDLQSLFDISPNDALEKMTNEEDKAFLIMQREDPSSSRVGSVDNTLAVKENIKRIRLENEDERKKKHTTETLTAMQTVPSTSAVVVDESEIVSSDSGDNEFELQSPSSAKQVKKAPIKVITPAIVATLMAETRSSSTVWLLGKTEKEIICGALPTKGHTLQKMVYHHLQEHHTVRESAKLSVQAVCAYWEKARIPVQRVDSCERKLLKLYDAYKLVKKNRTKTFENYRVKEQMFKDDLQSLFDISPNDALEKMTNEEDKAFLIMQREDPSSSRVGSVNNTLAVKENIKRIRLENEDERKKKHTTETLTAMQTVPSTSAVVVDESEIESSDSGDNEFKLQSPSSAKQVSMSLSKEERIQLILLVGNRSHREVAEEFNRLHPDRAPITHSCVDKLAAKFRETGSIEDKPRSGPLRTSTDDHTATASLAHFMKSPKKVSSAVVC
uniref:uncharacterized protein isoform X2 n=1 Tax=Myxine glutinosa TaxID=7769 RepID=UPI00358F3526